ncbi:MAG: helix-turn-helix transcriptional regulator [Bacteroidales bacterium]|nr:helix-turn-helix transcriptional regulator [Bacteroidales bacterium]MBQ1753704.1 helix-turn-helix transcriptional regulator [Bacteroidales bacterium]MBQ2148679.1 helix-turn-helix transcriptional regulator [Bacteroidales bacterium]
MKNILKLSDPNVYARFLHAPVLHPLVSIIHYDEVSPIRPSLNRYGVYGLFIQRNFPKNLTYGMKMFDAPDGSIIAVEPGQIGGKEDDGELINISGWALLFSPELLHGTDLEARMREYPFFSYFSTETLKMEPSEWSRITQLLTQLRHELEENPDSPSLRSVILGYLRIILEYCQRIYLRQLSREDKSSSDLLKRFHSLLRDYYLEGKQLELGVPSVNYCAEQLAYSARYLGDMIHKATGGTAIGYIHSFVIDQGKNLLMNGHNVNETAHLLGFEFPHHFTRLFKKVTGLTPTEFLGK